MRNVALLSMLFVSNLLLLGCAGNSEHADLREFIDETKKRPQGQIDPLPAFTPYEAFTYSAARLRNPFEQIVADQKSIVVGKANSNVKPNLNRTKELLENYNFASLSMVGTARVALTAGPLRAFNKRNCIPALSVAFAMAPPKASISFTKWLLPIPPIAGLQDICPKVSML